MQSNTWRPTFEQWLEAEPMAVCSAGRDYAQKNGLCVPTLNEIEAAERSACGHTDYYVTVTIGRDDNPETHANPATTRLVYDRRRVVKTKSSA